MDQEQISSLPAEGDKKEETSYGKFNSAEELLKAYTGLESEFTKRSQKLKELEAQVAKISQTETQNAQNDNTASTENVTVTVRQGVQESAKSSTPAEGGEDIVDRYYNQIQQNRSPRSLPKGGAIPISPVSKARSIREAGEIAKKLLERM